MIKVSAIKRASHGPMEVERGNIPRRGCFGTGDAWMCEGACGDIMGMGVRRLTEKEAGMGELSEGSRCEGLQWGLQHGLRTRTRT